MKRNLFIALLGGISLGLVQILTNYLINKQANYLSGFVGGLVFFVCYFAISFFSKKK